MNDSVGWLQFLLFMIALVAITEPLGAHLAGVLDPGSRTWLDRFAGPFERLVFRVCGLRPDHEQTWWEYCLSLVVFSAVGCLFTYGLLRFQDVLPLNPEHLPAVPPGLAFNTAVSFTTNTNWQSYSGETTLSYFSQMVALTFHNFLSAAAGVAVAAALVRGIARKTSRTLGSFWVDTLRLTTRLFLPASLVFAVFLLSQGVIQNFSGYVHAKALDGSGTQTVQVLAQGPVASQVAIKMLGTNGGGFFNANAAHPFENPTPLSNFLQMLSIFAIPSALTWWVGKTVGKPRHGWALWATMAVLFVAGFLCCWKAESAGTPATLGNGVALGAGNMEGKEQRFGVMNSALFATITTDASCGAVNAMHDSFTPLGGLVPLFNMETGEVIFGGVGAGIYGILLFVILAVFISGLMVGRTPEYLGKKIEAFDVKMVMLVLMTLAAATLFGSAWAASSTWGAAGLNNQGPHGFSEILYAYTSAVANNGSAFAGLTATPADGDLHYNVTLGVAMLVGRFLMIVPILALAGNLASKKQVPESPGTFTTDNATFVVLLLGTIVLVGALTFLPALVLGPVLEHFLMKAGLLF